MTIAKIKLRNLPPVARPATKPVYVKNIAPKKPMKPAAGEIELLGSEDIQDEDKIREEEEIEEFVEEEETEEMG